MTIHVKANIFIECKFKLPDGEGGATVVGSKKKQFYSRLQQSTSSKII